MKEIHVFYAPDITINKELPHDEAQHITKVLRMKEGEEIIITDGKGSFYKAELSLVTNKLCCVQLLSRESTSPLWQNKIEIAVAPTKHLDRMEWFVEKATEIGIDQINFVTCEFSERKQIKIERMNRIAISAMKQSHKAVLPQIPEMMAFNTFIKCPFEGKRYIAHCYDMKNICDADSYSSDASTSMRTSAFLGQLLKGGESAQVLIGPEGDFSRREVEAAIAEGFIPVSLGNSRLRTETAALVAVHLMNLANSTQ